MKSTETKNTARTRSDLPTKKYSRPYSDSYANTLDVLDTDEDTVMQSYRKDDDKKRLRRRTHA